MVMIGRAAQGLPWLPGQIAAELEGRAFHVPLDRKIEALAQQLRDSIALYEDHIGIRMMRKHFASFVEAEMPEADQPALRAALCRAATEAEALNALDACRRMAEPKIAA